MRPTVVFEEESERKSDATWLDSLSHADEVRFWSKVGMREDGGCWMWLAATNPRGYGNFWVGGTDGTIVNAHRVSYRLMNGPIPHGEFVCHSCDTPGCVNPSHLFLGSRADNIRDMVKKGRQARGARSPTAVLSANQVKTIRALSVSGFPVKEIARRFRISESQVRRIISRQYWDHIEA